MNVLADSSIVLVSASPDRSMRSRADALEQAGAMVRACLLTQDLWSLVSEGGIDLCLLFVAQDDAEALALFDQLRQAERTRALPILIVARDLDDAATRGAAVVSSQLNDAAFVQAVSSLVLPMRRVREVEAQQRALRTELRKEVARANRGARDIAELGHELRSMLDAVMGFACNLRDELAGPMLPDQKSHVAGILDAVARGASLLDRTRGRAVVSQSRNTESGSLAVPVRSGRSLARLSQIAAEVVTLFHAVAVRKDLRVSCALDDTVSVWGDALKLKQVVSNLVVNALKYTPAGGEVLIRVAWSTSDSSDGVGARRAAEISVADTGPGIAPEHREQIFRRGFRVDSTAAVEGEGIGLAVVHEVVTQHGGTVSVSGKLGVGATFTVSLPQDRRQRVSDPRPEHNP